MITFRSIRLEHLGLVAVLGLILFALAATAVRVLRAPETPDMAAPAAWPGEPSAGGARASVRDYSKPLTLHTGTEGAPGGNLVTPSDDADHRYLIPDAPEEAWSRDPLAGELAPRLPAPASRKPRPDQGEEDEGEDDLFSGPRPEKSGWGWLADDILSTRNRKDEPTTRTPGSQRDNRTDRREEDRAEEEDPLADDRDPLRQAAGGDDERDRSAYRSLNLDETGIRSPLAGVLREYEREDRSSQRDRDTRPSDRGDSADRDDRVGATREGEPTENPSMENAPSPEGPLAMRDPFARSAEGDRPAFGARDWSFNNADDGFARQRDTESFTGTAPSPGGSAGGAAGWLDSGSGRIVGDAASDASRYSSAWSGYASDSMFSGGGGYTPQGVSALGSDALFSGAGVFGGGVGSSVFTPLESSSGGLAPLGGSSLGGGLPTSGSSFDTSPLGGERTTPSALPW